MATSGTISTTVFNVNKIVDTAYRRCRLPAASITPEMQGIAKDALHLILSEIANYKTPSWCIEKILCSLVEGSAEVTLPLGTVEILNVNYRKSTAVVGTDVNTNTDYTTDFTDDTPVSTVGVTWASTSTTIDTLLLQVSSDGITFTTVNQYAIAPVSGVLQWFDLTTVNDYQYFRLLAYDADVTPTVYNTTVISSVLYGTTQNETPLSQSNRDTYVWMTNKLQTGNAPVFYYFQRDIPQPIFNIWPAANSTAAANQLVVWRHRHIMDITALNQEVDVPQRWLDAFIARLAYYLSISDPQVDAKIIPLLKEEASVAMNRAWQGDNDGSSTFYQPAIGCYTR